MLSSASPTLPKLSRSCSTDSRVRLSAASAPALSPVTRTWAVMSSAMGDSFRGHQAGGAQSLHLRLDKENAAHLADLHQRREPVTDRVDAVVVLVNDVGQHIPAQAVGAEAVQPALLEGVRA